MLVDRLVVKHNTQPAACQNAQAAAMADSAFQGETGAVKAVMKRLQRGSHKRGRAGSSVHRASSVTKMKHVGKQKGES